MLMQSTITPEIGTAIIRELAQAVVVQALRDLKSKRIEEQLDAALWIAGDDLPIWLAAAIDDDPDNLRDHGVKTLTRGRRMFGGVGINSHTDTGKAFERITNGN